MSLKNAARKIREGIVDLFNAASMEWPEPQVQAEMKKDGWTFGVVCPMVMHASPVQYVLTPQGQSAYGIGAAKTEREKYLQTIAQKREILGLKP